MQRYRNPILVLIVLLILIAGASVWYHTIYNKKDTIEKVNIKSIDLATEGAEKIPANFPKDIPIQPIEIVESYEMEYPERKVVVSVVTVMTYRDQSELFENYKKAISGAGYVFNENKTNQEGGTLYFGKERDSLFISIVDKTDDTNLSGYREVRMVYTSNNI